MRNSVSNLVKIAQKFEENLSNGPKKAWKSFSQRKNAEFAKCEWPKFWNFAEFNDNPPGKVLNIKHFSLIFIIEITETH